jgi:tRNA(adenine34) deaminase
VVFVYFVIKNKMNSIDEKWMGEALKEAKKALSKEEVPVGAVIVHNDKIIGRGYNQVELLKDPTAHAEMIAITAATNYLQEKWLYNSTLYVTVEPCSMCAGAIVLARMNRVIYGVQDIKAGAHSSLFNLLNDPRLNHSVEVVSGILNEECSALMIDFFENIRKKNNKKSV